MDLIQILTALQQAVNDAQASAQALADLKFQEGAASRQAEVDELKAKVAELQAIIDAGNPNPGPTQEQLDAALAEVAALSAQVLASQSEIEGLKNALVQKDQAMADFKSQELEKVKALEVDFT